MPKINTQLKTNKKKPYKLNCNVRCLSSEAKNYTYNNITIQNYLKWTADDNWKRFTKPAEHVSYYMRFWDNLSNTLSRHWLVCHISLLLQRDVHFSCMFCRLTSSGCQILQQFKHIAQLFFNIAAIIFQFFFSSIRMCLIFVVVASTAILEWSYIFRIEME